MPIDWCCQIRTPNASRVCAYASDASNAARATPVARAATAVPPNFRQFMKQQLRWKRSWTRESLIVGSFIWRKHPAAALATDAVVLDFADEQSVVQTRFATSTLALLRAHMGEDLDPIACDAEVAVRLPLPLRARPLEELWTEAREERAVRALAAPTTPAPSIT